MRSIFRSQRTIAALGALALSILLIAAPRVSFGQQNNAAQQAGGPKKTRVVGVIKSVSGNTVTLTTDAGADISVTIQPATRLMRLAPGQTDLRTASPIQVSDVQVGDRMLVGGIPSDDGKSIAATSAVIMKKSDVAEKQQHDREEWQKNGVGGVVKAVDVALSTITLSTGTVGAPNTMTAHVSKDTIIRRYAPDSIKFDDAKPGTLEQIKAGDQLRARGTKSEDGKELAAAEIVSGTFRSIAATVISAEAANNTITVTDLVNKRPVTLKIAPDSQMHQLPAMFAQRIAMRLKGGTASGQGGARSPGGPQGQGAGGVRPGESPGGESRPGNGRPAGRLIFSRC